MFCFVQVCAVEVTRPVIVPNVLKAGMEKVIVMEIVFGEVENAKKRMAKTRNSWIGSITIPISNVWTGASAKCLEMQNWRAFSKEQVVSSPTNILKDRI